MPVMNVNLVLDDATFAGVQNGALELCGLVKNVDNRRIVKHLPTVIDSAKDGATKAIDIIRENKGGLLIAGGVIIVGGAVVGTLSYFSQQQKNKAAKHFKKSLDIYLEAAKNGEMSVEILDSLINDLDSVSKHYKNGKIPFNITTKQMNDLLFSIYDYTKRMAVANHNNICHIDMPTRFSKNNIVDLRQYLEAQKQIISKNIV